MGACGAISRKAKTFSSSYTFADGISPAMILQNRQSDMTLFSFQFTLDATKSSTEAMASSSLSGSLPPPMAESGLPPPLPPQREHT